MAQAVARRPIPRRSPRGRGHAPRRRRHAPMDPARDTVCIRCASVDVPCDKRYSIPAMIPNLHTLAVAYVKIIGKIERTGDRLALQQLEEQRVEAHNAFADALKAAGIRHKDREHVTRIAFRIAKDEL